MENISSALLDWFYKNHRILPFRTDPSPYHVWLSEIMLQQTRVSAALPYYERFLAALPDIPALAACEEEKLHKLWEGLGYYSRVRNLQKAARIVCEQYGGQLPADYDALRALPGIGDYTAGAIASISFGIPVPAVDGNVLRVISRVTGSREDILKQSVKKEMEDMLVAVMFGEGGGNYNQALIEIGAIVCVPNGEPLCRECPMASVCVARRDGLTKEIPVKTPKKARRIEKKTILVLDWKGRTAIRKREDSGLLASLYEFPNEDGWLEEEALAETYRVPLTAVRCLPEAKHIFSHVEWHMRGFAVELQEKPAGDYLWVTPEEIRETYSLPGAFKVYTMST